MTQFAFNQPVTLKNDHGFYGWYWGRASSEDGREWVMVAVKKHGKSKYHDNSNVAIPEADVEPTEERRNVRTKEMAS